MEVILFHAIPLIVLKFQDRVDYCLRIVLVFIRIWE